MSQDFAIRHLSVLSYAQGFTAWVYTTPSDSVVVEPLFMQPASDMLSPGDTVVVSSKTAGAAKMYAVDKFRHLVPMS